MYVFQRNNSFTPTPDYSDTAGTFYLIGESPNAAFLWSEGDPQWKMGPNLDRTAGRMNPNAWYLVKMHFDMSSATTGGWEMWKRTPTTRFTKVAGWYAGITENFTMDADKLHTVLEWLKFPGSSMVGPASFQYYDDITFAEYHADLPSFGSARKVNGVIATGIKPQGISSIKKMNGVLLS